MNQTSNIESRIANFEHNSCSRKSKYPTKQAVKKYARIYNKQYYKCPTCKFFHLTSINKQDRDARRRINRVIDSFYVTDTDRDEIVSLINQKNIIPERIFTRLVITCRKEINRNLDKNEVEHMISLFVKKITEY